MTRTMQGEYRKKETSHIVVYTDYTGNTLTKNGMEICGDKMLLHRTGGFEGDMLFDQISDTFVQYGAFPVQSGFMLHTEEYILTETPEELNILLKYTLYDESGNDTICGEQSIKVHIGEEV